LKTNEIYRGMIKIGITSFPILPCKGEHTLIRFHGGSRIIFNGGDIQIMKGCSIVLSYGGNLSFGKDVVINQRTLIYSNSNIEIGNHIRIGWSVQIYDTPFHYMIDVNTGDIINPCRPITISNNVWIANHATITAGAKIPPFTTIASHSLVNKDFMSENTHGGILIGTPACYKPIGKVRLFNNSIEYMVKDTFKHIAKNRKNVNVSAMGFDIFPLDGDKNLLYRTH